MRIPGERIKRTRLIQTEKYVVAVEVEMVVPVDDPSEPCFEPETVLLLREIKEHAERGRRGLADQRRQSLRGSGGCVRDRSGGGALRAVSDDGLEPGSLNVLSRRSRP
jgi:hypothetical protein